MDRQGLRVPKRQRKCAHLVAAMRIHINEGGSYFARCSKCGFVGYDAPTIPEARAGLLERVGHIERDHGPNI